MHILLLFSQGSQLGIFYKKDCICNNFKFVAEDGRTDAWYCLKAKMSWTVVGINITGKVKSHLDFFPLFEYWRTVNNTPREAALTSEFAVPVGEVTERKRMLNELCLGPFSLDQHLR